MQDLVKATQAINRLDALTVLIRLFRFADSRYGGNYELLSKVVAERFTTPIGLQVQRLLRDPRVVLFNRWQLLFGIKLVCTFGADKLSSADGRVPPDDLLELLLNINDFIDRDNVTISDEANGPVNVASAHQTVLKEHFLFSDEQPQNLVGRYYNLLFELSDPSNAGQFDNWVNLPNKTVDALGISSLEFAAILFGLYSTTPISAEVRNGAEVKIFPPIHVGETGQPFCIDPSQYFRNIAFPLESSQKALELISCSPEDVKRDHQDKHGDNLGKLFDLTYLIQHPVVKLKDNCYAALSHNLLIQRLSVGLFWDIHDHLPSSGPPPNRLTLDSFWGRLIEQYGTNLLRRVALSDPKRRRLITESEYKLQQEKTADVILIEKQGQDQGALFEFTVGRPRLFDSLIPGNLQAFEEDMLKKLGSAIDQEIDLLNRLFSGEKQISGVNVGQTKRWLICVVVADPYPSYDFFLGPLKKRMQALHATKTPVLGPLVLSLNELEQLEAMGSTRGLVGTLLDWVGSSYGSRPFSHFAGARARNSGTSFKNEFVRDCSDRATEAWHRALFPTQPSMHR